jgi:hypothetical protein
VPARAPGVVSPGRAAHRRKLYSGDSGPGRSSRPPGRPIQDHLQLITPPSSAHAAAPSYGAESISKPACQPMAPGRSTPHSSRSRTIHRSVVQPVTQLVATGRRSQDQQRQDRRVPLHEFDQGIATAGRSARDSPSPHPRKRPQTAPGAAARTHPPATPLQPRGTSAAPKLATAAFTVFGEHPTIPGCRRHV